MKAHEQGLIINTSEFSKGAIIEANLSDKVPAALMNSERLVELLVESNTGVPHTCLDLIELGESDVVEKKLAV